MDLPGFGVIPGEWDLRGRTDQYLDNYLFGGKRVLEVGPASGFLTFEMEARGATVVCLEVSDETAWDFVPYPPTITRSWIADRRDTLNLRGCLWCGSPLPRKTTGWIPGISAPVSYAKFLKVLGFETINVTTHQQAHTSVAPAKLTLFSIRAERSLT